MAMTLKEFVDATGAEVVGDRLILGERAAREYVGSIEGGTFVLNEKGQAILEDLEAGVAAAKEAEVVAAVTPKGSKGKKAEAPAPAPAPAAESDDSLDDLDLNV